VVTLRDPSPNSFLYVLNNLYRTKRYGAQTTRTGQVRNKIVAVIFADGEIFSNLRLTQKLHDLLGDARLPYAPDLLNSKTEEAISSLIKEDGVLYELVIGEPLEVLQNEAEAILSDETAFKAWLNDLSQETLTYAEASKVIKKK
ncbi:MAG: type I-D CRISPR-associated protein Cas7/Csc2, partial [Pseudanabaena sp.]